MADQENEMEKIKKRLNLLEIRLARLESSAVSRNSELTNALDELTLIKENSHRYSDPLTEEDKGLELQIGRFGLAWLGNIVLLLGMIFLTQYLMILGHGYLSVYCRVYFSCLQSFSWQVI